MEKLYTKKQVIDMLNEHAEFNDYYPNVSSILENYTPIQLPTDEEIYELAKEQYPISMEKFGNEMMDGNIHFRSIFIQGVEWMRDKIKGGNNE